MKKLFFLNLLASICMIVLVAMPLAVAHAQEAERYWTVKISKPAEVMTSSTINLDYIVFSTVAGDTFDVTLLNNGSSTGIVQTIATSKGGNSGRFTVKDVPDGQYSYSVLAKNIADGGSSQVSDSASFTVNTPDSQTIVVSGDGQGNTSATAVRKNTTASGAQTTTAVTADGSNNADDANKITEASSDQAQTAVDAAKNNNGRNLTIALIGLIGLIIGVSWYGITRFLDKNET